MSAEEIMIDDAYCRAFAMVLGVNPPRGEIKKDFIRFCLQQAQDRNATLNEDFVYKSISRYVAYLYDKRA